MSSSAEVSYKCVMEVTTCWDKLKQARGFRENAGAIIFNRYVVDPLLTLAGPNLSLDLAFFPSHAYLSRFLDSQSV